MRHPKSRFKRRVGLWLVVALIGHLGVSPGEASAWVLCFGADGHVAVEPAGHDHRLDAVHAEIGVPMGDEASAAMEIGASPCIDMPVVSEDHGAHKPLSGPQTVSLDAPLAAFAFTFIPIDERVGVPVSLAGPPIVDPRLPARRSVVLLI